jgi:hypothetical protein
MEEELAVDLAGAEQYGAKTMEQLKHSCGRKVSSILEEDRDKREMYRMFIYGTVPVCCGKVT